MSMKVIWRTGCVLIAVCTGIALTAAQERPKVGVSDVLPDGSYPGEIRAFAFETAPKGWLECNGDEVPIQGHKRLFAAIGTQWGSSNPTKSFKLPDLRGMFLRGWNHNQEPEKGDPDAGGRTYYGPVNPSTPHGAPNRVGSYQPDEFIKHNHAQNRTAYLTWTGQQAPQPENGLQRGPFFREVISEDLQARGGKETRPRNAYVMYCIRDAN
jgi:hypothetical protein